MSASRELDPTAVLRPLPDVTWVSIEDEVVVYRFDPPAASFVLDSVAALVWRCLDGSSPLADIIDDVAEVFATDHVPVELDCMRLATFWVDERLAEAVTGG